MMLIGIIVILFIAGIWAAVVVRMVFWNEKRILAEQEEQDCNDQVAADGPEIDLSGDDDDYPTPRYFGDNEVIFEHI